MFMADRFRISVGSNLTVEPPSGIFSPSFSSQGQPPFSESVFEKRVIKAREVSNFVDSKAVKALLGNFAHAGNLAHIERSEKFCFLSGDDPENAVRLCPGRRNFCDEPRNADPNRAVQLCISLHLL